MSLQERRNALLNKPFRPQSPSQILPFSPQQQQDPKNPAITIQSQTNVPIRDLLKGTPTEGLYLVREIIDEILASRPDSKR